MKCLKMFAHYSSDGIVTRSYIKAEDETKELRIALVGNRMSEAWAVGLDSLLKQSCVM
jgi:hypothetical protein